MKNLSKCVVLCLSFFTTAGFALAQQNPPLLQITSPANGTIVNPGQTIWVTITSPANASFSQVGVVGEGPIEFSDVASSVPGQVSITVPMNITACRKYALTAVGVTTSGQRAQSDPVLIDVERADFPGSISSLLGRLELGAPGTVKTPFIVTARFGDGKILDVTRSSRVSFTSSNPAIATIDADGMVTAVAAGSASITATYTVGLASLWLSVPVVVAPPLTVSPDEIDFGPQVVGTTSSPRTVTFTNASSAAIQIVEATAYDDFSQTNTCVSAPALAPGALCQMEVTFTPSTAGARTGSVNVLTDFDSTSFAISLTGTGTRDFSIAATPTAQTVKAGKATTYTISVSPLGGFAGTVALSVSGLPTKATATFSPTSISGGSGSSTLTVKTSTQTPLGTFPLTIIGTSGSLSHTATVTLTVNPRR